MGQTEPALCTHCGGEFIRDEDAPIPYTITEAGRKALEGKE
jgi:hypothetical protein